MPHAAKSLGLERYREQRNRERKNYYNKTSGLYPSRRYSDYEDDAILHSDMTDSELSVQLQRSVQSIQSRRSRLRHQYGRLSTNKEE